MTVHRPHDPVSPEVATAAARLRGTPEQLAARLRTLLDEGSPKAVPRESADARREREAEGVAHDRAVAALRHRLAGDFADDQDWRPTISPLSTKEVARRATPGGNWHRRANEWSAYLPYGTFYRGPDGRVAGATGHLPAEIAERDTLLIELWAAEQGLTASLPDYPSWQDPGRTRLLLFTSAEVSQPSASNGVGKRDISAPALDVAPVGPASADPTADEAERAAASNVVAKIDMEAPEHAVEEADPAPKPDEVDTAEPAPPTAPELPSMRSVMPIDLADVTPRDLADEDDPDFDVVDPAELLIDEAYQRGLSPKSLALIRRIVENWSWAKFKVPTCVRVDGRLHVLDGQHSVIAAATHPGIQAVPVLIAKVPAVADRAAAFVSHATNRLQATAVQIHRAALTAGDEDAVALDAVCRGAGVELLPFPAGRGTEYAPGQTVAVVGIRRLIEKRGPERATEILSTLAAAELAPIAGDHVRLAELLLCDDAYTGGFTPEQLTVALRSLTAKIHAEARELAIAQRLAPWRALAAVLYRNHTRPTTSRKRASA